jgi:hypothetical protein
MSNLNEIRRMIATTQAGDTDRILDILEKLVDYIESVEHTARDAMETAQHAADENPFIGASNE